MGCLADKNDASVLQVRIGLVRGQGFHVHRALIVPGTLRDGRLLCGLHLDVVVGVIDIHPDSLGQIGLLCRLFSLQNPDLSDRPAENALYDSPADPGMEHDPLEHKVVRKCQILNLLQVSHCSPFCRPGASRCSFGTNNVSHRSSTCCRLECTKRIIFFGFRRKYKYEEHSRRGNGSFRSRSADAAIAEGNLLQG